MNPLEAHIRELIERSGPISVARFMELALTHPELGYYTARQPFGARGDFVTAPEISQMFGELIGLFVADYWLGMASPAPVNLIELGPGRGTLMADALRAAKIVPEFEKAAAVRFVEVSPVLRKLQKKAVPKASFHDTLDDVPQGISLLIANEFFDALPIRQFVKHGYGWAERMVGVSDGKLAFCEGDSPTTVTPPPGAKEGDILEASPQSALWVGAIAQRLTASGGLALIIDYGYADDSFCNTLQAVKAHAKAGVLENPGEQDLTAHVNFAALKRQAQQAGLKAFGPVPQGEFLKTIGIEYRAAQLLKKVNPKQKEEIETAVKRLTARNEMGELFKVIALTGSTSPPPEGFPEG